MIRNPKPQETEREIVATEQRLGALEQQRSAVSAAVAAADGACLQLRGAEEALRLEAVSAVNARYGLLLATARAQRTTKRLEVGAGGREGWGGWGGREGWVCVCGWV